MFTVFERAIFPIVCFAVSPVSLTVFPSAKFYYSVSVSFGFFFVVRHGYYEFVGRYFFQNFKNVLARLRIERTRGFVRKLLSADFL